MDFLSHLDLLSVGVIIAAIGILGFVIFYNNPKSITNKTFLIFCLLTIAWGSFNYLSYQIRIPEIAFWLLRLSIFTAVWHSLLLFQLLYVFPKEEINFPKNYTNLLLPLISLAALLNLTPFTFNHIAELSANGQITKVQNGPGIILFSFIVFALVISAIVVFIKKIRKAQDVTPRQVKPILIGIIITFALILFFNFILPAFFNNSGFISFGAFFVFPFVVGTAYSIFKHQFLNIKVISTEILTFILALVILIDAITSPDFGSLVFRAIIFILVIIVGILLIKSVVKEVQLREKLEVLDKELAEANVKLQALDKARAEFITIASHQLRTPPATIKWYMSALLDGDYGKFTKEQMGILDKTNRTNNSLISLIDDMLNVSRIERGKMEFLFEPANLLELANITFEQLEPISIEKHLKLIFKAPRKKPPVIMADKEKIRQVMNNMIDNALKYTRQGTVTVRLESTPEEIKFSVQDTGKGFSAEEKEEIFQKYSRGKESIKQSAGLGLGLYVAKVIVEQHKGKLWAESPGPSLGSTFIFTLPVHSGLEKTTLVDLTQNQK